MTDSEIYLVDDLEICLSQLRVVRAGEPLKLPGLTFKLLAALVKASPALLTYEEISQQVWNGRPVTPETIAQRAKMLREALSDQAKTPRYVELVRGQGYRLIPKVKVQVAQTPPAKTKFRVVGPVLTVFAAFAALLVWILPSDESPPTSVAVLPFEDLSASGNQQYLGDGMAAELISQLALLDGLRVASRTQSFFYREPSHDVRSIGEQLGVESILEGSIRVSGDSFIVAAQLIDVTSGFELWSGRFDRQFSDLIEIQADIARSLAGALGVSLGAGDVNEFSGAGTENVDAYDAYLRGDFQRALELDPNYAAAWGRRGVEIASEMWRHSPQQAAEIIARARPYVTRAIELNPNSAQALTTFAIQTYVTLDWESAQGAFMKAADIKPTAGVYFGYGNMLMRTGRSSAAESSYEKARGLELTSQPKSMHEFNVDLALQQDADVQAALSQLPPDSIPDARWLTAINQGTLDDVKAAMAAFPQTGIVYNEFTVPLLRLLDDQEATLNFLEDLADNDSIMWPSKFEQIALVAAYFDNPEFAWRTFERDVSYTTIRYGTLWYPVMAKVRSLPEFKLFLERSRLVDYWRRHGWPDHCWPLGTADFTCGVQPP